MNKISHWHCAMLAIPSLGANFFMGPMAVIPGIYAKHYGIALTSIAVVLLVGRLFDAVTDPLIGYLSDRNRVVAGSRKPFVLVGGLAMLPCCYFLYTPPASADVLYFAVWFMVFYLAHTVLVIPHLAWASEITSDPENRSAVFSWFYVMSQLGAMLFYCIPFLPIFASSEITPETMRVSLLLGVIVMLPSLYLSLKYAPVGRALRANKITPKRALRNRVALLLAALAGNRPFLIYMLSVLFKGLGLGIWGGLVFIYVDAYLGLGAQFSQMALLGIVASITVTPLFYRLSATFGKKRIWMFSAVSLLCGMVYTGLLRPGEARLVEILILQAFVVLGSVGYAIIAPAVLSDVIDYGQLKDPVERSAIYFSVQAFLAKAQGAVGVGLGLAVAGWFGFDVTTENQSESGTFGILLAAAWLPAAIFLLALFFIQLMPLDERRNAIVRRRLDKRQCYFESRQKKHPAGTDQCRSSSASTLTQRKSAVSDI